MPGDKIFTPDIPSPAPDKKPVAGWTKDGDHYTIPNSTNLTEGNSWQKYGDSEISPDYPLGKKGAAEVPGEVTPRDENEAEK